MRGISRLFDALDGKIWKELPIESANLELPFYKRLGVPPIL
jgi:hypothetical protein